MHSVFSEIQDFIISSNLIIMFDFQRNLKPIFILKLHYLQNPRLSETKQWIKQRCISHIKIVIFNLTQRLHSVQLGFLCCLLSKSERQRRIPEQTNISYLERLLSLSPIKQTQGSSFKIFSTHLCLNSDTSLSQV